MHSRPGIRENMPLVYAMARRLMIPAGFREDVIQSGFVGLVQAAESYDDRRGTAFSSYAVPFILGEMRQQLRRLRSGQAGRRGQSQAARVLALREEMTAKLGREPSLRELAAEADLSPEETAAALGVFLPQPSVEQDRKAGMRLMQLSDGRNMEEASVNYLALRQALGMLEDAERRLVKLRFFQHHTQQQTGEALGLSQVQVSRMEQRVLKRLRLIMDA